jgi:hypothetical protein
MPVILTLDEFLSSRVERVENLLRPFSVVRRGQVICQMLKGPHRDGKVITSNDLLRRGDSDYRDWRFRSYVPSIWFQYFELWQMLDGGKSVSLYQAYLNVFRQDRIARTLNEFVCIHCDPSDGSKEPLGSYKRGPHLHVVQAESPLCDSHFPLNLSHLEAVLHSAESLTEAIGKAFEIIREEVLEKCRELGE